MRAKSQKCDKRPSRGGATAQWTPNLLPIEWTPHHGHPCQIWFWSVDAFLFYRGGVEISCFLYLAERPIQQCFALPCSAVIHLVWHRAEHNWLDNTTGLLKACASTKGGHVEQLLWQIQYSFQLIINTTSVYVKYEICHNFYFDTRLKHHIFHHFTQVVCHFWQVSR